jgi:hypothetical protein
MATRKHNVKEYLTNAGFMPQEATQLSKTWTITQFHTLPYLQNLVRTRRLYVSYLVKKGHTNKEIQGYIKRLYANKDWTKNGKRDPWTMVRDFRKASIDSGGYVPVKRKGSHHALGVSKGDIAGQKQRRKGKIDDKIANLNAQIDDSKTTQTTRDYLIGLRKKLRNE